MENNFTHKKYSEDFKKTIVTLYQNGKTQAQLIKEYGISQSAINAQLEEENIILKKAIAIFTPHSDKD